MGEEERFLALICFCSFLQQYYLVHFYKTELFARATPFPQLGYGRSGSLVRVKLVNLDLQTYFARLPAFRNWTPGHVHKRRGSPCERRSLQEPSQLVGSLSRFLRRAEFPSQGIIQRM